ncbi:MAG: PAS domain S-box protein [Phaeospirillum sp.]|nr:PAS domain S-box protein [Phaeospirillum sp.]
MTDRPAGVRNINRTTKRKTLTDNRAGHSRRDGDELFRCIFEGMNDPILLLRGGQFVDCNTATLKLLGHHTKVEFLNRRPSEISPARQPDGRASEEKAAEMIATALREGFHRFEWVHVRADSSPIPVEVTLTPITVGGELILHTLWRDITERKLAEEALRRSETKLRTIYDSTYDAIMLLDQDGFIDCNAAALAIFGCATQKEFCSKHPADMSPPVQPCGTDSQTLANQKIATAMRTGRLQFEWAHRRADTGAVYPAEVLLSAMELDGRRILQAVVRDITERKAVEETLRNRETLLRLIYDTSSVAIFFISADGTIGHANHRMSEMFSLPMQSLIGSDYVNLVHPSERKAAKRNMLKHLADDIANVNLERRYLREDGTSFWGQLTARRMKADQGHLAGLVCVVADITERKLAEQSLAERSRDLEALNQELATSNANLAAAHQELERLAMRDTLTGAWNRRCLAEIAQQEMLRMERYAHPVAVIFIDLDHFKQINDTHGHAAGDAVLREFCDIARQCMRATDMLGRWGGEEFVIVTPNSGLMIASLLAERIRTAMVAHHFMHVGQATASFGVAECRPAETWDAWLARADAALYSAKQAGRNRVVSDVSDVREAEEAELLDLDFLHLVWRNAYESGRIELDAQHRGLFAHANTLLGAIIADHPKAEVVPMIEALLTDLLTHFNDEEGIFRAASYAEADHHAGIHRTLTAQAIEMSEKFAIGELAVGDLFNFLAYDVVAKHMLSEDRKFFPHLAIANRL